MAVPTVAITGKVYTPDGNPSVGGHILARLLSQCTVLDGSDVEVVHGIEQAVIANDGSVDFALVPSDLLTSVTNGSTAYKVTFSLPGGFQWVVYWDIDSTGANPIDIGDIQVLGTINGQAINDLDRIPDVVISNPQTGQVLVYNAGTGKWENADQSGGAGATSLTALSDTTIAALIEGDYLNYDATAAKWKNRKLRTMPVYTDATRPTASGANRGLKYRVNNPGEPEREETILEDSSGTAQYVTLGSGE